MSRSARPRAAATRCGTPTTNDSRSARPGKAEKLDGRTRCATGSVGAKESLVPVRIAVYQTHSVIGQRADGERSVGPEAEPAMTEVRDKLGFTSEAACPHTHTENEVVACALDLE